MALLSEAFERSFCSSGLIMSWLICCPQPSAAFSKNHCVICSRQNTHTFLCPNCPNQDM